MELVLVRHALPVRIEDAGGPADPDLAPDGLAQADAVAAWLADEQVDGVWSSPMARARQTATPIAARLGREVVIDDELAEFDRDQHFYIPLEELKESADPRWVEMIEGRLSPDGEVDAETFRTVVVAAMDRVVAANRGKTVAVVCHGGVINAYLSSVLGIDDVLFFEPYYTSITRVLAAPNGIRSVRTMNETAHLRGTGL